MKIPVLHRYVSPLCAAAPGCSNRIVEKLGLDHLMDEGQAV